MLVAESCDNRVLVKDRIVSNLDFYLYLSYMCETWSYRQQNVFFLLVLSICLYVSYSIFVS